MKQLIQCGTVVALLLAIAGFVLGQAQFATLSGTLTDETDARVPAAQISLVNENTGEEYSAASNESGNYTIPLVKPGIYTLAVELAGFKKVTQSGIRLETGIHSRVDVELQLGAVTESISVSAAAPLLQGESSAISAVTTNKAIIDMPLIDRRAAQLARLIPNVIRVRGGGDQAYLIGGGRAGDTSYMIDGGEVGNVSVGTPYMAYDPPVESLEEFTVAVSTYSAEWGHSAGGGMQMTTKSGTNDFHGSLYEYLRNDALDARNFFSAAKAKLRYNLFGASLGGPIVKDKTHFFFNYEGQRERSGGTAILNVPTPEETRGDFSAGNVVIRDPLTAGRLPFPGNIIPEDRLDPIGSKIASFYPAPNVPGRSSGSSNYRQNRVSRLTWDNYIARVDHTPSAKDRVFGRFVSKFWPLQAGSVFPVAEVDSTARLMDRSYWNLSGTYFRNFNSTTINELRVTYARRKHIVVHDSTRSTLGKTLGIPGVNQEFFPNVGVTGYTGLGTTTQERVQAPILNLTVVDNLTHLRGNHTLKMGYEFRYGKNDELDNRVAGGDFRFNSTATNSALAALLLGWVQQASISYAPLRTTRSDYMGAFIQDDWKVTPRLTLNLGLRWDLDQPLWEATNNKLNSFDRWAINPVSGTPGIVTFMGRDGRSKYAHNYDWNNFGPRVGFAWRVTDKWVVRGGGAIVYAQQYEAGVVASASLGSSVQGSFVSPDNGLTPALLLRDGVPPVSMPSEADLGPGYGAVPLGEKPVLAPQFFEPEDRRNGYSEQFSFNIQRLLSSNMVFEMGYLGRLSHKMPAGSRTINQVPPDLMGSGNAQLRRPFPQFSNVTVLSPAIGNSNYHALSLKVEKRYSAGLHFQGNYTWSRFISDEQEGPQMGGNPGGSYANYYDRASDRGLSGNHISHRFVWSSVYELPVGRGRAIEIENAVLNHIFGGWSSGVIAEIRSGLAYGVTEQVNRTNAFSASQRPDVVGNPKLPGDRSRAETIERWFDTSAFAQPAQYTFGNAGKTAGYGPGAVDMDVSILKSFPIREGHRLQFRAEMLSVLNRPIFGLPNRNRGHNAFGRITSADGARIVQFGLNYRF